MPGERSSHSRGGLSKWLDPAAALVHRPYLAWSVDIVALFGPLAVPRYHRRLMDG